MGKVARSAFEARALGYLRAEDGITFNRDRLLADAKARALALADGYAPPEPAKLTLPGPGGKATLKYAVHDLHHKGRITSYNVCYTKLLRRPRPAAQPRPGRAARRRARRG